MSDPPSPRAKLEFASLAKAEFSFLSADFGLRLVEEGETRIRYESQHRFINVYHARGSYQVGVELGRWIAIDGQLKPFMYRWCFCLPSSRVRASPTAFGLRLIVIS